MFAICGFGFILAELADAQPLNGGPISGRVRAIMLW
jgi:hypothetical protein